MSAVRLQDVMLYAGGECFAKFGTPIWRMTRAQDVPGIFTRSGAVGSFVDKDGIVRIASANRLRIEWIGGVPYLLHEPAAENLFLRSADLSTTWINTRSSDASNSTTAPDGTTTADTLIEDGTASDTHYIRQSISKASSALKYVYSAFAKAKERSQLRLVMWDAVNFGNRVDAEFDISAGTVLTAIAAEGSGWTAGFAGILRLADTDWYRIWFTGTSNSATTIRIQSELMLSGAVSYNGDNASGLFLWGAMLERTNFDHPSSYIPTAGSAVTRNLETFAADFRHPTQAMAVYAKFLERGTVNETTRGILGNNPVASNLNSFWLQKGGGGSAYEFRIQGGASHPGAISTLSAAPVVGDVVELAGTMNAEGAIQVFQSINGGAVTSGPLSSEVGLPTAWAESSVWFGSIGAQVDPHGVNPFAAVKIVRGAPTIPEIRSLFEAA